MSPTAIVAPEVRDALASVDEQLTVSGTWWTVEELAAIAERARGGFAQRNAPPWMRELPTPSVELSAATLLVIDTLVFDAGSISAEWAQAQIDELGVGPYTELVGVTAVAVTLDMHAVGVGEPAPAWPPAAADPGSPTRELPGGLGDIGAYVPMLDPFPGANIARALTAVPSVVQLFYTVARPMYSDHGFTDLVWESPLARPQVELVASRVAAMNECFY